MTAKNSENDNIATIPELRSAERIGVRTPVVVYEIKDDGSIQRSRAWTDDLSANGARLISETAFGSGVIYVRIMLPDFKDQILKCELVRVAEPSERAMNGSSFRNASLPCYGVRFVEFTDRSLEAALERATKSNDHS
jgi:hypothetical protein